MENNVGKWLRRNSDENHFYYNDKSGCVFYGVYMGHKVRYHDGEFEVGHADFDRWANSVAYTTILTNDDISRQVNIAITEARKAGAPDWHHTMKAIHSIFNRH